MNSSRKDTELLIQTAWKDERCPILNGIVFGTGHVKLLHVEFSPKSGGADYTVKEYGTTDIGLLEESKQLTWTYLGQLFETFDKKQGIRISCGEGGMGGDGFVAVSKGTEDWLEWIAFFDCSNPFVEIKALDDEIVGMTNIDNIWRFSLQNPGLITVS